MPNNARLCAALPLAAMFITTTALAGPTVRDYREDTTQSAITGPIYRGDAIGTQIGGDGGSGGGTKMGDPFDAHNMQLLSWIPLNNFPGGQSSGNDCWGYVSPSGREYAIMGVEKGFAFVEVTDPFNPVIVGNVTGPSSIWHDIKVMGDHAYGVSEGGSGIQVIDLSDIDNGNITHVTNHQQNGHSSSHNIVANTDSGFVYVTGGNIANGGLLAFDVTTNPDAPNLVGTWNDFYVHDAQIVSYTSGPNAGKEIAFCLSGTGNGSGSTALRIVDVTNKSNMFVISTISWSGARYAHQGWLSEDRRFLYVNDELDEGNTVGVTTTRIFNVENLASPSFVRTFTSGVAAIDHNLYTANGYIYETNYRSGLRIFDAADPANPVQVAWFDTFPGSDSSSFNGAWSNYPFLPSGNIIISDIERGMFVVRLALQRLDIDLVGSAPLTVLPGSQSSIDATITEVGTTIDPATVQMIVSDSSGTSSIAGTALGGDSYRFNFENLTCFDTVSYYLEAQDTNGIPFRFPAAGATDPLTALVASGQSQSFADSFATDLGWTVSNSGGLTAGAWERGQPAGGGDRGDPASDFDGNGWAYLTENAAGNTDVDDGSTSLISPTFDATGGTQVFANYAIFYSNSFGGSPNADIMTVEVSNNNGASWTALQTVGPTSLDAWELFSMRLDDFITPTANMKLRFTASDLGNGSVVEAAVDAVTIDLVECDQPSACPGDIADDFGTLGSDDQVSFGDFLALLGIVGTCPGGTPGCVGDIADDFGTLNGGDGMVSFGDFLALLGLVGPCP